MVLACIHGHVLELQNSEQPASAVSLQGLLLYVAVTCR